MRSDELFHYGILGQKWGQRNGPPYPLHGGDYSKTEATNILKARKKKNSIYNKKHFDEVVKEGSEFQTLSYDKNRTQGADMFYAAFTKADKHQYNAMFNHKVPQPIFDEDGNEIGTGQFLKYKITNTAKSDINVASEDSGGKVFAEMFGKSRDFYNFVTDPTRMEGAFVKSRYKFKGYREAKKVLDAARSGKPLTDKDLTTIYRMFNYILPSDGGGNARLAKDVLTQRTRFFAELKKAGYGAVLDTNDAIYGGFKAQAPVIVFDMGRILLSGAHRTTTASKRFSTLVTVGRKAIGL